MLKPRRFGNLVKRAETRRFGGGSYRLQRRKNADCSPTSCGSRFLCGGLSPTSSSHPADVTHWKKRFTIMSGILPRGFIITRHVIYGHLPGQIKDYWLPNINLCIYSITDFYLLIDGYRGNNGRSFSPGRPKEKYRLCMRSRFWLNTVIQHCEMVIQNYGLLSHKVDLLSLNFDFSPFKIHEIVCQNCTLTIS